MFCCPQVQVSNSPVYTTGRRLGKGGFGQVCAGSGGGGVAYHSAACQLTLTQLTQQASWAHIAEGSLRLEPVQTWLPLWLQVFLGTRSQKSRSAKDQKPVEVRPVQQPHANMSRAGSSAIDALVVAMLLSMHDALCLHVCCSCIVWSRAAHA